MSMTTGAGSMVGGTDDARRLRALFDHLPAMIAFWDRDLHNVIANEAYVEWFGFTPEQMRGIHIREVLGEEVYAKNLPFITGALAGEEQLFERTLIDTAGNTRHTQASYVPEIIDGEVQGFFVLVTDVTPRVTAQRAMDEAQRLAQLGSWSYDLRTEDVTWTAELYRIFGEEPGNFVPTRQAIADRVHPDDIERLLASQDTARETGQGYANTYRIVRPDGTVREVHSRGEPHFVGDEMVRLSGTVQDVTETNEAARELSRVNRELRQANQLSADVLAMLGHDVRAPLGVLLGFLEELVDGWATTPEEVRLAHARRVQRAAQRLENLIDNILSLATLDAASLVPRPSAVSVAEVVADVLGSISGGDTVEVTVVGDPVVTLDPFHLRQILANLVANAFRYGEPPVSITVRTDPEGCLMVSVRDHGPGVPAELADTLFERFVHAGTPKEGSGSASGFGLYIAARLAAANGASLSYEATDGACFTLTLPAARPDVVGISHA